MSGISTVLGGGDDCPTKDGWTAPFARPFGPGYAEKRRRMEPGGRFCHSDNAPQDGDSVGAAGATHSRHHLASNAGPRHPPCFCRQQPSNGSRRRWSWPVYFGDNRQPIHHLGLRSWEILRSYTKGEYSRTICTLECQRRNGGRKVTCLKVFSPCHNSGPLWRSRARGCGVSGANLACVHRHTPR